MLRVSVLSGNSSNCVALLEPFLSGFRARSEFMCGSLTVRCCKLKMGTWVPLPFQPFALTLPNRSVFG